jgi:D-3-phosphoglycerate dehydrogenase / 2-oxoglutarate reductase
MKKILVIDKIDNILENKLLNAGFLLENACLLSKSEISKIISNYFGIIIRSRITIDKPIIDKAKNLKFVARVGSGMESIDTQYCKSKNILCLNSPEGNRDAVAEQCIGMLLNIMNNLVRANHQVKTGIWQREANRGTEIKNKTIGIIGYGNTGGALAKKLSGFECNVISYDKYKKNYSDKFTKEVSLNEIFLNADILSLHIPLNDETKYMVNHNFISNFTKNIILLNSSRGPIVETKSLVESLKSGKIISAGLDVIEYEESSFEQTKDMTSIPDFQYLANCENVILSPHIAGWTKESLVRLSEILAEKIIKNFA